MADEKLTVAELLARSGRASGQGTRPRRSRSVDDSTGISVAELTGTIPVVPSDPKSCPEQDKHEATAEANTSSDARDSEQATKESSSDKKKKRKKKKAFRRENASAKQSQSASEEVAAQEVSEKKKPAVPHEKEHNSAILIDPRLQHAEPTSEKLNQSSEFVHEDLIVEQQRRENAERIAAQADAAALIKQAQEDRALGQLALDALEDADRDTLVEAQEIVSEVDQDSSADTESTASVTDEDDDKLSIPILILQVILAFAVGVALCIAFIYMWNRLNPYLVGALALLATGAAVLGVHKLVKYRDRGLLVFTAIVGLVLTIAVPYIVSR